MSLLFVAKTRRGENIVEKLQFIYYEYFKTIVADHDFLWYEIFVRFVLVVLIIIDYHFNVRIF